MELEFRPEQLQQLLVVNIQNTVNRAEALGRPEEDRKRRGLSDPFVSFDPEDQLRAPRTMSDQATGAHSGILDIQLDNIRRGNAQGPAWSRQPLSFLLVAVILLFAAVGPAYGQRTNFCERAARVANGSMAIRDALEGLNPSVAMYKGSLPEYFRVGPNDRPVSGFLYNLLQRVAAEGSFEWRYELTPDPTTSDDVYLADITTEYDTVAKVGI